MIENTWIYFALIFSTFLNIIVPLPGILAISLLAIITDPKIAIALASFYFLLSGFIRIALFRKYIQWRHVKGLWILSAVGATLGALALFTISDRLLLLIIIILSLYFLYKKIFTPPKNNESSNKSSLTVHAVGLLSGFLQGTGLSAGRDLRNNFLYSRGVTLVQLQGTTAVLGAINFLLATIVRLVKGQITIPDLSPFLIIFPFMVVGVLIGKYVLKKIDSKFGNVAVLIIMATTILFLVYKFISL